MESDKELGCVKEDYNSGKLLTGEVNGQTPLRCTHDDIDQTLHSSKISALNTSKDMFKPSNNDGSR